MAICRMCGVECPDNELLAVYGGVGGCLTCNGSPACTRCGHARKQHWGAFAKGIQRCEAEIAVDDTLASGRCGCAGYTSDPAAYGEETPAVDVVTPRLRIASSG